MTDILASAVGENSAEGAIYLILLNSNGSVKGYTRITDNVGGLAANALSTGDQFGSGLTQVGDLNNDGVTDLMVSAARDNSTAGAAYVLTMNSTGTVASHFKIDGSNFSGISSNSYFGMSLEYLKGYDINGKPAVAVGAYNAPGRTGEEGALYLIAINYSTSSVSPNYTVFHDGSSGWSSPLNTGDRFGISIASMGYVNNNNNLSYRLAVGAPFGDDGATDAGAVHIIDLIRYVPCGWYEPAVASYQKLNNGNGGLNTFLATGDKFGDAVANIGDIDNDGVNDLAVAADFDDGPGPSGDDGAVHILLMNKDKTVKSRQEIYASGGSRFGLRMGSVGDLNNDGVPDLAVGSIAEGTTGALYKGAVYICFLNSDGTLKSTAKINQATPNFTSLTTNDMFGASIANAGDFDKDGVTDILVAATGDNQNTGAVYLIYLNTDGSVKGYQKINNSVGGLAANTLAFGDQFGSGATAIGDLNNDGVTDFMVSAWHDDQPGLSLTDAGAAYILFMNSNGTVKSQVKISASNNQQIGDKSYFGASLAYLKDFTLYSGTTVAVGLYNPVGSTTDDGAIQILELSSTGSIINGFAIENTNASSAWNAPLSAGGRFGLSITALGYETPGNYRLAVGAPFDGANLEGAAYVIDIEKRNPCVLPGPLEMDSTTGITADAAGTEKLTVYPNPASGVVNIQIPEAGLTAGTKLQLTDMQGKIIEVPMQMNAEGKMSRATMDISSLKSGVYLIRLQSGDNTYHQKLIKQ